MEVAAALVALLVVWVVKATSIKATMGATLFRTLLRAAVVVRVLSEETALAVSAVLAETGKKSTSTVRLPTIQVVVVVGRAAALVALAVLAAAVTAIVPVRVRTALMVWAVALVALAVAVLIELALAAATVS